MNHTENYGNVNFGPTDLEVQTPGINAVIISTWTYSGYHRNIFNIKSLDYTHGIYGILCEKSKWSVFQFCFPCGLCEGLLFEIVDIQFSSIQELITFVTVLIW